MPSTPDDAPRPFRRRAATDEPGSSDLLPPDTSLYTTFWPTNKQASYATFNPLPGTIGDLQPFSFNLLARFGNFGVGLTSGYVTGQTVLTLSTEKVMVALTVVYTPDGFALRVTYGGQTLELSPALKAKRWYDITFTWDWDCKTATGYLDGGAVASSHAGVGAINRAEVLLGSKALNPPAKPKSGTTTGPFFGDVKRLLIWNVALTAAQAARQSWTSPGAPLLPDRLLLGYDFTINPATAITEGSRRAIQTTGTAYLADSPALFSQGDGVATPGEGTTANPGGAASFSVLAWIFTGTNNAVEDRDGYLLSNGDATDPAHLGVKLASSRVVAELGSHTVTSNTALELSKWYYVGVTYDGRMVSIYINKKLDGTGAVTGVGSPAASALRLFGILNSGQPSGLWAGFIQFLSIWNTALTADQVEQQMCEDPTLDTACTANFMLSSLPLVDSTAVEVYGLWGTDELQAGTGMSLLDMQSQSPELPPTITEPRSTGAARVGPRRRPRGRVRRSARVRPSGVEPFSAAHRERMAAELASALQAVPPGLAERWMAEYRARVDEVFGQAAAGDLPRRWSYREVDGQFVLFHHPEPGVEVDTGIRVDLSQECLMWWVEFISEAVDALFMVFGISTPSGVISEWAMGVAADPIITETLQSVTGMVFTAGTLLSLCKVLYDFGYLSQVIWMVMTKLGWWAATRFIAYVVGLVSPIPTPQQALFIAECVAAVAQMTKTLLDYPTACGTSAPELATA